MRGRSQYGHRTVIQHRASTSSLPCLLGSFSRFLLLVGLASTVTATGTYDATQLILIRILHMALPAFCIVADGPSSGSWSVEELETIFQEEGTDKQGRAPGHSYVQIYASMLGPWKHKLRAMAEVGIGSLSAKMPANMRYWWWAMLHHRHVNETNATTRPGDRSYQPGASLRSWRRYFSPSARIIGLDIDPHAVAMAKRTFGIEAYVVNTNEATELANVLSKESMDLLIDDGDHSWSAQQQTLLNLWPYLAPGGFYFIEDVDPDEFHNETLQLPQAHALMARLGAALIHPNPKGRANVANYRQRAKVAPDKSQLVFLRKPLQDQLIHVKTRIGPLRT